MENQGLHWNVRETKALVSLFRRRRPLSEISEVLGRSEGACRTRYQMIRAGMLFHMDYELATIKDVKF